MIENNVLKEEQSELITGHIFSPSHRRDQPNTHGLRFGTAPEEYSVVGIGGTSYPNQHFVRINPQPARHIDYSARTVSAPFPHHVNESNDFDQQSSELRYTMGRVGSPPPKLSNIFSTNFGPFRRIETLDTPHYLDKWEGEEANTHNPDIEDVD